MTCPLCKDALENLAARSSGPLPSSASVMI
jgi:hypothetical protein